MPPDGQQLNWYTFTPPGWYIFTPPLTWLADHEKVSSKVIQRVLRHQNLATTERYIQRIDSDLMGTMNRLRLEKTEGNLLHDLLHDEKEGRAE